MILLRQKFYSLQRSLPLHILLHLEIIRDSINKLCPSHSTLLCKLMVLDGLVHEDLLILILSLMLGFVNLET